jgi:hypothetical protein
MTERQPLAVIDTSLWLQGWLGYPSICFSSA